jgi:CheY-like chemotaxis protein
MADKELREIPVIMLTMVNDPARGFMLGAADFATKPINRKRLSEILKKYIGTNPSALIVEEDPTIRNMTRDILEKEGWKVNEAESGTTALECMKRERPTLVLLDLMMPEMDGFEFADLMQHHPEMQSIPLVVVTAKDLTVEERRQLSGCVQTVLHKVSSRDALLARVRDIVVACAARAKGEGGSK